jgi:hypothetical protein
MADAGKKRRIFLFCYNRLVRRVVLTLLSCVLLLSLFSSAAESQGIEDFVLGLQNSLKARDFESYLRGFSPRLREEERETLSHYFDDLKMETANLHWANKASFRPERPEAFLQVIYQNPYSALIETWQLGLERAGAEWRVREKKVRGGISQLYKLRIPGEHLERVESIEIRQVDITLTFKDALVFYDNVPDLETALLVLGQGHLTFAPSDPGEQHQLELIFKSRILEDTVSHAFLRFSKSFFEQNVTITRKPGAPQSGASEAERNKAYSLFVKYYPHYYTIQSPLSSDLLSFLPQADETVIEFDGKKSGELAYIYSPFAVEEVSLYERGRDRYINLYSPPRARGQKRMVITFGQKCDVEDYQIELDFEPQNFYLSAKARIRLRAELDRLDAVKFKFNPDLQVLRVYDEAKRELFYTQDKVGKTIYVYFFEPIPRDRDSVIEIVYRGRLEPPLQVADIVTGAQYSEPVVFIPPRYETYLYSQSALWYPAPPDEDYFTARLKIIVPPEFSSVSNGRLLEKGTLNGMQRVTEIDKIGSCFAVYQTTTPVKYLSFLVGKLSLMEEKSNPMPLSSYVASDVRWSRRNYLEDMENILGFYKDRFGPFPFESLRLVQRLWPTAGGHSPASFIVLNELPRNAEGRISGAAVRSPNSPVDLSEWREYFLAHEIAHQWWGQGVAPASYRDQWLSEGLAQFASVLYLRSVHDSGAFPSILKKFSKWTEKKAKWGPITLGSRISFSDFQAYQAIIYDKSTLVLNMLCDLLGDEVFFEGLGEFFNQYKYSAATTGQFMAVMERVSDRQLGDFFSGWFDSHLLPEVRVAYQVQKKESGDILQVKVEQLNEVFSFPLWLEWTEGKEKVLHREKLVVQSKNQVFEISLSGEPRKIKVNPDRAVPGKFVLARG